VLKTATEQTMLLFQHSNTTSYLETLTAQQSLLSAQMSLITDKYNKLNAGINLYKALGGGRE
jgi:outer membrane protein TolC